MLLPLNLPCRYLPTSCPNNHRLNIRSPNPFTRSSMMGRQHPANLTARPTSFELPRVQSRSAPGSFCRTRSKALIHTQLLVHKLPQVPFPSSKVERKIISEQSFSSSGTGSRKTLRLLSLRKAVFCLQVTSGTNNKDTVQGTLQLFIPIRQASDITPLHRMIGSVLAYRSPPRVGERQVMAEVPPSFLC